MGTRGCPPLHSTSALILTRPERQLSINAWKKTNKQTLREPFLWGRVKVGWEFRGLCAHSAKLKHGSRSVALPPVPGAVLAGAWRAQAAVPACRPRQVGERGQRQRRPRTADPGDDALSSPCGATHARDPGPARTRLRGGLPGKAWMRAECSPATPVRKQVTRDVRRWRFTSPVIQINVCLPPLASPPIPRLGSVATGTHIYL